MFIIINTACFGVSFASESQTRVGDMNNFQYPLKLYQAGHLTEQADEAHHHIEKKYRPLDIRSQALILLQEASRSEEQELKIQKLTQALTLAPELIQARELIAILLIKQNRYEEAENVILSGISLLGANDTFRYLLAQIYLHHNKIKKAERLLSQLQPKSRVDVNHQALMATIYLRLNKLHQARYIYRHLLTLDSQVGAWWLGLALSSDKLGRKKEALHAYEMAQHHGDLTTASHLYCASRIKSLTAHGES